MAVERLSNITGEVDLLWNAPFAFMQGEVDLYTDQWTLEDSNTLVGKTRSNVFGEMDIQETRYFSRRIDRKGVSGIFHIYQKLVGSPVAGVVTLREGDYAMSNVQGMLDIYATNLPPVILPVQDDITVYFKGVNITDRLQSVNVGYSIDKYVGEATFIYKDWVDYPALDPKDNFGELVYSVYSGSTHLGDFLLEKRSGNATFRTDQLRIWGRTRPALLGIPYSETITRAWNDDTRARTIVDDVLTEWRTQGFADITLSWNIMDYPVLAGKVVADHRQPIQLIADLASPVGGILTTNFAGELIVDYKWKTVSF